MFTNQKKMKGIVGLTLALVCAISFAPTASASYYQTQYYYPYATATYSSADIQRLMMQVQVLMAQLQALQAQSGYKYHGGKTYTHTYQQSGYKSYDVEVETADVDSDDDESATFIGEIELDDAPYADVWFEYGQDGDLDESTADERMDDDGEFEMEVDDLDEDERYYVRAVAEDPSGSLSYGNILAFTSGHDDDDDDDDDDNDDDIPEVDTQDAENVDENSAELHGEVDMNDFEDGLAFFVYGQDEDAVEEVEDESEYDDIDEEGEDLQKFTLMSGLDGIRTFWASISGLEDDSDYFFRICVEYEDEDNDTVLECGAVESFTTDEN
jgi:hypothetical protein